MYMIMEKTKNKMSALAETKLVSYIWFPENATERKKIMLKIIFPSLDRLESAREKTYEGKS